MTNPNPDSRHRTATSRRAFLAGSAAFGATAAASVSHSDELQPLEPSSLRQRVLQSLGGDWPTPPPLQPRVLKSEEKENCQLLWVRYRVEPDEEVPAILILPPGVKPGEQAGRPAIAVWHQHAGQWHLGKTEPAGLAGNAMHHTGLELAKLGYVVLCPDALCFEERQDPDGKLKGGAYERFEFLRYVVAGKCMAWKNILDMRRAIDFLESRPETDAERMGCYGHSMGSTHTWLVGPWEPRLKCLVGNCCLPTYAAIHRTKILHCFPNFIPGLFEYADTPDLAGLIAPRPLHLNFGELDGGSPVDEVRQGVKTIRDAYRSQQAEAHFTHFIEPDAGHVLSPRMWERTRAFFAEHLHHG